MIKNYDVTSLSPDTVLIVSVIMSVYDGIKLEDLRVAIDSILNQTFRSFEFIIVLDGVKRDDIKVFLEASKNSDGRIRLLYITENKGLANAMNNAIKLSASEFIIRMDADDISHHDRIEKMVEYMQSNPDLDVAGSFIEEFSESAPSKIKRIVEYPTKHEDMKKLFAKRNPLAHASSIFRRDFFDKAGFYSTLSMRNEDTLLWLSGFVNGCKFSNFPEVLYSVRFSKGMGLRRVSFKKSFSDLVDRLRVIIDLNASWVNLFFAIGLFIIQSMPYPIYRCTRSMLIHNKMLDHKVTKTSGSPN